MKKQTMSAEQCCQDNGSCKCRRSPCGDTGAIYGMGLIGALFYFLQGANTFVLVLVGIGKAIFWPAFVMFKVLTMLQM